MSRPVSPGYYYRLTWQIEIILVGGLLMSADVVRAAVALPILLLSLVLVSPLARHATPWRRPVAQGLGFALFVVAVDRFTSLRNIDDFVATMLELILGALPFMLLRPERPRSYWLATLTIAVVAVGSISFTSDPAIYVGFIAFMVLLLFNLNAANLYLADASGQRLTEDLPGTYFRQFVYVIPIGLLSAMVIFVVFPRARTFSLAIGDFGIRSRIGYSGAITLAGGGEIEASERVAFLVAGDAAHLKARPGDILMRGVALDTFDGRRWTASTGDLRSRREAPDLRVTTATGRHAELVVMQEATHELAVFYPGSLLDIPRQSPSMGELLFHSNGSVSRRRHEPKALEYTVRYVDPGPPVDAARLTLDELAAAARAVTEDGNRLAPYAPGRAEIERSLTIPAEITGATYWTDWRRELGFRRGEATLTGAVDRLRRHFRASFEASLANEFSGEDAFAAFLAQDRRGHCEYFATATALLLRSYGVPARVVLGFKGGTYNHLIDMLEVRDANAHAWVEALVPGVGWHTIDVTPGTVAGADGWSESLRLYGTALTVWFRRYVVNYDHDSQRDIVRSLSHLATREADQPINWRELGPQLVTPGALVIASLGVVFLWMRRRRRDVVTSPLPVYYLQFQVLARRRGVSPAVGETYARYHRRVRQSGLAPDLVDDVDRALEEDLYTPLAAPIPRAGLLARVAEELVRREPR